MRRVFVVFLLTTLSVYGQTGLVKPHAMVVSARREASEIGAAVMRKGGNAFDAMVATELALAVAYPYAGNIGGGGFLVFRKANGETGALDYREKAPMAARRDMYLDASGNVIPGRSTEGALAVGVPGTIAGIFAVHERFGKLPLRDLFEPVIALAEKGVIITENQEKQLVTHQNAIVRASGPDCYMAQNYIAGDTLKYPALAATLRRILQNGRDEFYKKETAQKMVTFLQSKGGILTLEDLATYEAKWRTPVVFTYKNVKVISMSPPSSGGITLAQILKMLEPYPLEKYLPNGPEAMALITEAERRAYADRNHFLGDPDFVTIPQTELLDPKYLKSRMKSFDAQRATPSTDVAHGAITISESNETTHYSIVDPEGNAVAVTTTLNGAFGSKLYSDELGFFFNNEMDDFSSKPGVPNSYGLVGAEANAIAPGKRMLSSMTPTIVERKGKLLMVLGTPGGSTIITSVLQVLLDVCVWGMNMQQAVNQPRFHHQWLPDEIMVEPGKFQRETLDALTAKGYKINEKSAPVIGKVDAILVQPDGQLEAGADRRGDDAGVGF